MNTLFTVGYEKREVTDLLDVLVRQGVKRLIDVRQYPNSRRKGFSKSALSQKLATVGIDYESITALGSPPQLRREYHQTGDFDAFTSRFIVHLDGQNSALDYLLELAQEANCFLLCYEREAELCHRSLVAERIQKLDSNGLQVHHL